MGSRCVGASASLPRSSQMLSDCRSPKWQLCSIDAAGSEVPVLIKIMRLLRDLCRSVCPKEL